MTIERLAQLLADFREQVDHTPYLPHKRLVNKIKNELEDNIIFKDGRKYVLVEVEK